MSIVEMLIIGVFMFLILWMLCFLLLTDRFPYNGLLSKLRHPIIISLALGITLLLLWVFNWASKGGDPVKVELVTGKIYEEGIDEVDEISDVSSKTHPNTLKVNYENGEQVYILYPDINRIEYANGKEKVIDHGKED